MSEMVECPGLGRIEPKGAVVRRTRTACGACFSNDSSITPSFFGLVQVRRLDAGWRIERARTRVVDDGQTRFFKPAHQNWPVPAITVLVHRVCALNRCAVMAADHPRAPRRAVQGPSDRAHAGCANVESTVRFHLAFLEFLKSVMIYDVQGGLIILER